MWMDVVHSKGKGTSYPLRVRGNGISPDYLEGDIMLTDYSLQPLDGEVVSAPVDRTEITLKVYSS